MNTKSAFLEQLPRPFIIFGMGITGQSVFRLLKQQRVKKEDLICLEDKQNGPFSKETLLQHKTGGTILVSPGISLSDPFVQNYLKAGGVLSSELEIAFSFLDSEKIISVTGSLGKSTTSALLFEALKSVEPNVFLGGNFGKPLAEYVTDCLEKKRPSAEFVILELSSYQLENFKNLRSEISVITYLAQNHMDRYLTLPDYYNTKLSLIHKTAGQTVCNKNGGDLFSYLSQRPFQKIIWTDRNSPLLQTYNLNQAKLIGKHNQDNLALAAEVLHCLKIDNQAYKALITYSGLPHRLENLGVLNQITFINDSKATTIDSVTEAILNVQDSFPQGILHILLGGRDKGLPWEKLSRFSETSGLRFYFFGECAFQAQQKSKLQGLLFKNLAALLPALKKETKPNDVVLLSPGGSSLDEFSNFEERGNFFKNEISKHWSYSIQPE